MLTAKEFWDWFVANNRKFLFVHEVDQMSKEKMLDEIQIHLHDYCDKLFFEIGGKPLSDQELIITAEGRVDYFKKVEELLEQAPLISNWKFIAFKPAHGNDAVIEYQNMVFNPHEIWFIPLQSTTDPNDWGFRFCYGNFDSEKKDLFLGGTYLLLDGMLGERKSVLEVKYVEVDKLPEEPEESGLLKMIYLDDFLRSIKK